MQEVEAPPPLHRPEQLLAHLSGYTSKDLGVKPASEDGTAAEGH